MMAESCPVLVLCGALRPVLRDIDAAVLLSEIGVPPDLRYLVDGLRRTESCLMSFPDELDICLRAVLRSALEAQVVIEGIHKVLDWANRQKWSSDDPRMQPMQRPNAASRHPLAGHYLSALFHWGNLFYSLQPNASGVKSGVLGGLFDRLMAEFSGYTIAAQAAIDPDRYLRFCHTWWASKQLPDFPLYESSRLASRTGNASRAMRQLSLSDHERLFLYLSDVTHGAALHSRVFSALKQSWPEPDQKLLDALALLLEEIRPGWQRPDMPQRRRRSPARTQRAFAQHRAFRDGYIRIPEQNAIRVNFVTDGGVCVEHFQQLPGDSDMPEEAAAEDDVVHGTDASGKDGLDGAKWIPVDEQQTDGDIDALAVEHTDPEHRGELTSRWAAAHLRRHQLALGITRDRLSQSEAHRILDELARPEAPASGREALVALHACLSLGRTIEDVTRLEIREGKAGPQTGTTGIQYFLDSRQWSVACPAPAWADRRCQYIERKQWDALWLNDRTGFLELLKRFDLAVPGRPFQHWTESRQRVVDEFLQRVLPQADATIAQCSSFLFYRLLQVSHGDLGIASLITGHEHSHSRSVRHYANYPPGQIWKAYEAAWTLGSRSAVVQMPAVQTGGYGAKRVPSLDAVRALVEALARRVQDRRRPVAERHNSYTAYTWVGMILGMAVRPVAGLLMTSIGGVSDEQLLASFIDKARSDYDRRVNPVPRLLADQLQRYARYRNWIAAMPWVAHRHDEFLYRDPVSEAAEPFRPGHFSAIVGRIFPLELYALRRFVRSELEASTSVEGEDLDAYMGHWLFGASPFDPLSTYPARRLHEFASGPLAELLTKVGFRPLDAP